MSDREVWILGATGRVGRAVAAGLAGAGVVPVLVGRDRERLLAIAGAGMTTVVAGSPEVAAAQIRQRRPAVVVNTIGPFAATAVPIARACLPGGHYVDLANDLVAVPALLALHEEAVAAGSTVVTGAGFGVLATEAVVAKLCQDLPPPGTVRVDALASVGSEAGAVGSALAASVVEVLATGGRRYRNGRLVKSRLAGDLQYLVMPDGTAATTASAPTGELVAAQLASGAPSVLATSGLVPTSPLMRGILPLAGKVVARPRVRKLVQRGLAAVRVKARPRPRPHSWGHAVVRWKDGASREGWLRADDAMDFTVAVMVEVATRLARGDGPPGAYTPAAAFGPDLATAAGGTFVLD